MKQPSVITTRRPTPEETAKLLGIPGEDVKALQALVEKWAYSPETIRRFGEPRNGHTRAAGLKKLTTKRGSQEKVHR